MDNSLILLLFYLIILLGIPAALGFIPASIAKEKGYSFGLWWFFGFALFIVAVILINVLPNKNEAPKSSANTAEELKKYKELLDIGAINNEEFEQKKKQILG